MVVQENLGIVGQEVKQKKTRPNNNPTRSLEDKIKADLKEWNTLEGVELYKDLYNVCSQLFLATQDKKLQGVNYYIDHEKDSEKGIEYTVMYAEIQNTCMLPMPIRYKLHADLLERVMYGDTTLVYCNNSNVQADEGQLSLFS